MTLKNLKEKYINEQVNADVISNIFQEIGSGEYYLSSERFAGDENLETAFGTNAPADDDEMEWDEELYESLDEPAAKAYKAMFRVETISDRWASDGIVFSVSLTINDGAIHSIAVDKYEVSDGCRPSAKAKRLSSREIEIAGRILDYVTK